MKISVVIATHNRTELLQKCLTAVFSQTQPAYEVIVVDDASTKNVKEIMQQQFPHAIFLRQDSKTGPAAARNRGSNFAHGDILAFTDDDCEPSPTWLQEIKNGFETYPDVIAISGIQEAPPEVLHHNKYAQYEKFVTQEIYQVGESAVKGTPAPGGTNNLAVPKESFLQIGGFDEFFPVAAGEDTDLLNRLCDFGEQTINLPITVQHNQSYTHNSWRNQQFRRGIGAAYFHHKQGDIRPEQKEYLRLIASPILLVINIFRYRSLSNAYLHTLAGYLQTRGRLAGRETLRNSGNQKFWASAPSPTKLKYIDEYASGNTVLDIGAGFGHYSKHLKKKGFDVTSIDIEKNCPPFTPFVLASLDQLPFKGQFDTVICFDVLEHEKNESKALVELSRVTATRLLLSVPNGDNALLTPYNLTFKHFTDKTHWREYTLEELKMKLESVGFNIVEIKREGSVDPSFLAEFVPTRLLKKLTRIGIKFLVKINLLKNERLLADIYVVAEPHEKIYPSTK